MNARLPGDLGVKTDSKNIALSYTDDSTVTQLCQNVYESTDALDNRRTNKRRSEWRLRDCRRIHLHFERIDLGPEGIATNIDVETAK